MGMISAMFPAETIKGLFLLYHLHYIPLLQINLMAIIGMGFLDDENGFEFLFTVLTTTLRLMEKVHVLA